VLDITATDEQLGKPAGADMVEGVYTLPVLHTLATAGVAADELGDLLGGPLDPVVRDKALSIVRSGSGIPAALDAAQTYVAAARTACAALPAGAVRDAMLAAPQALLESV